MIPPVAILRDARLWRALRMRTECVARVQRAVMPLGLILRDREAVVSKDEARAQLAQSDKCDSPAPSGGGLRQSWRKNTR
ncbi:hypothetical protein TSA1_21295 [Bradyrhizobium nitroreducens]|uniref:Uncharacterized protein n=1 Tax=Bradyrhizobium nitroreducens TaxID=709803 RepID=A0A2M6UEQ0_9BRAD|nr:hypothetical protein TSA1_21295 [Bradyrhizobium nitroreducens]